MPRCRNLRHSSSGNDRDVQRDTAIQVPVMAVIPATGVIVQRDTEGQAMLRYGSNVQYVTERGDKRGGKRCGKRGGKRGGTRGAVRWSDAVVPVLWSSTTVLCSKSTKTIEHAHCNMH